MTDVLVRDVSEDTLTILKARASRNGRSLQGELQRILDSAASEDTRRRRAIEAADRIFERLAATGRDFGDSVEDLREDRAR